MWLCNKKFKLINVCTSAALWTISKMRNDLCFQGVRWTGMRRMFERCARMLRNWSLMHKPEDAAKLEEWAEDLERSTRPPRICLGACKAPPSSFSFRILGSDSQLINPDNYVTVVCAGVRPIDGVNLVDGAN
jgi:hypothetical protein